MSSFIPLLLLIKFNRYCLNGDVVEIRRQTEGNMFAHYSLQKNELPIAEIFVILPMKIGLIFCSNFFILPISLLFALAVECYRATRLSQNVAKTTKIKIKLVIN